ncbi:hypothetical protein J437_LFUL017405 [Ladona fulva]|uniref:Uncharacterized protein n=1 Tax=Ladona fulva TaxID=123851 RepID=A0A8K0KTR8_LADFU|nr:hypothetical protein J437_LFUL017405 [Ladona fulva]
MKVSVAMFSLFLIGNIKGDILADYWKQGAANIGPIDLEPNLNGTNLFLSLMSDIGAFMEEYEKSIDGQFHDRIYYYSNGVYYMAVTMREAVSRANDSTPSNAFDAFMELKPSFGKFDSRRSGVQPHLVNRGLSDFLLHLDRILITDFSLLASYMEEMLIMGRQRIFEHYSELIDKYTISLPGVYSMISGYLKNSEMYMDTLNLHTTQWVLMNFKNAKDEVLNMIPK